MIKSKKAPSLELLKSCCRVLEEKKAGDLRVRDVSQQSSITDYLVLATATSDPHLRAMRVELEKAIDAAKTHIVGIEATPGSGWIVVDLFNIMVHLFLADRRSHYGLELLWKDATEISPTDAVATASKPSTAKKHPKPMPKKRKSGTASRPNPSRR
jgi:ribosome-associated protein